MNPSTLSPSASAHAAETTAPADQTAASHVPATVSKVPAEQLPSSAPQQAAEDDNVSSTSGEESGGSDTDSSDDFSFEDDAAAEAARQVGLKAYNEGRYDDALDQQYLVVRYFSSKYGSTSARCAPYFLDYGLSQLRVLQTQASVEDVLRPRDQEAMEACFVNLEVARVGMQKREHERGDDDVETELALAEVHNALAQLNVEREDFDEALREYEAELLIYRCLQEVNASAVPANRLIAVLYGIADCYMKEGDFEAAEERLRLTLEEVAKYPPNTIAADVLTEIKELLADAAEMKGGKFVAIQEAIQRQFAQEAEHIPTAHEFYEVGATVKHPFLSNLPGGVEGSEHSYLSMPMSATGQQLAPNEHSNSQSISHFPPQGSRASNSTGETSVQHAVVRKKPKTGATAGLDSAESTIKTEPELKKPRTDI